MEWATIMPLIWWGLVALLIGVAAWFFRTILTHRAPSKAHWRAISSKSLSTSAKASFAKTPRRTSYGTSRHRALRLGLEDCVIYLKDDDKKVWVQKAAYGPKSIDYRASTNPWN